MLTQPALHHGPGRLFNLSARQYRQRDGQLLPVQVILQTLTGQSLPLVEGLILVNLLAKPVQVQLFTDDEEDTGYLIDGHTRAVRSLDDAHHRVQMVGCGNKTRKLFAYTHAHQSILADLPFLQRITH